MDIFYPIQILADWLTYVVFGIIPGTLLAGAVNFFIFDTIKIFLLLLVIIFSVSLIRSFLPPEKIRNILSHEKKYFGNILASLLGIITPFCTCSAIPLFLGFLEAGVPLGTTFSFLVASPMINEVALVLLLGLFGWKIALLYIASGLAIAIISGIIIGHLKVENLVEEFAYKSKSNGRLQLPEMDWKQRTDYAKNYTADIIKKVWIYVVVGIGIGAWIHGYVPADFLARYAGSGKWYAVPLAVLVGIPLYSNAAGVIPLVGVLTEKGVSIGTSLAFMMAVTGLSLPEFLILKKVMKTKLILIFAGIVGMGIIFTGYLFNFILGH
ncbi:MAG: permease [Candidatus Moranbacteria bacterium]|nr:permease [bacterium]MDP1833909.1 permease [Candidatus Moranbacteria bacterium]MDZ4384795.1 permease [Candidatus Moranbacteria bacterium]